MKEWFRRHKDTLFFLTILFGTVTLFVSAYFVRYIFVTIGPGEAGVIYRRFEGGTDLNKIYSEGTQLILPWNRMYIYDVRLQERVIHTDVLSSDGLTIKLDVTVRYYPDRERLHHLHVQVGPDYVRKVVDPVTISSVREVIGQFRPDELYKSKIDEFQNDMLIEAVEQNGDVPVIFEDIIIRRLKLPELINTAIETKLQYEQQFLQYQFRLAKEQQEVHRKEIEATGISRFQEIVTSTLNDQYLKWKGVDATLELSKSPNSKVIIIGNDGNSLPIILSAENTTSGTAPTEFSVAATLVPELPDLPVLASTLIPEPSP